MVGGETLACPKCSRRIRIGFDVPRLWNRLGLAALVAGIALLVLYGLMPGISEALLLSYLGYLLLFDGIIVGFSPLAFHEYLSGYVRIPPDQSGSANPRK